MGRDVVEGLDWKWLEGFRRSQRFGPVRSVVVGAGTLGSLLPAHHPIATHVSTPPATAAAAAEAAAVDPDSDPDAAGGGFHTIIHDIPPFSIPFYLFLNPSTRPLCFFFFFFLSRQSLSHRLSDVRG